MPEDLSVIGFDDTPLAAHVQPSLTTVRQDFMAAGAAAARLLLARLGARSPLGPELPAPVLIIRDSIGPAPEVAS